MVFDGGVSASSSTNRLGGEGKVRLKDGSQLVWKFQTSDAAIGEILIAGHSYESAQGGLFLIDAATKPVTIEQLDVDLSGVSTSTVLDDLAAMKSTQPKVAQFVARCRGPLTELHAESPRNATEADEHSTH